jgi:hypothetical protein
MRRGLGTLRRSRNPIQLVFPFWRRTERRIRLFKLTIVALTTVAMLLIMLTNPHGRYAIRSALSRTRWLAYRAIGAETPRAEIEADRHRRRLLGIEQTRANLAQTIADGGPGVERFMKAAHMDPDSAVIRWGNFDQTLVLSSDVFEPDDTGRSYRLKPKTRSIWLIGLSLNRISGMFEIPDEAEPLQAAAPLRARAVPESRQSTNSWGCRGPEPNLSAPLRGIVLGDSVMQGLLVADDETGPACLERLLQIETGAPVSVLNTGVLGYSVEQYYYTLLAFGDRFRPHFVIIGICGNDFGDWDDPASWAEGKYWMDRISQWCRTRDLYYLVVPYPGEDMLLGYRNESVYPGKVSAILNVGGVHYLNPMEAFTDEEIRLRTAAERAGHPVYASPLYNRHLMGDNHLSAKGCALWAEVVRRRMMLFQEWKHPFGAGRDVNTPVHSGSR